jgi:hypothetical protein
MFADAMSHTMSVNAVNGTSQIDSQQGTANPQSTAAAAQNNPLPEDTVTLSPAALALQTEDRLAAAAAQNALSPSAQALQNEQKLAAAAAAQWKSALALTID